jgi:hypothetical protein
MLIESSFLKAKLWQHVGEKQWAISLVGVDDEGYAPCSINHHLCVHHKSFHET